MKKMYIGIYAAIALLIIVGTFSWFVYGIIRDSDTGAEEAKSTFAYFANRIFVFKSNNSKKLESVKFVSARIMSLLIEMLVMFILTAIFKINDKIAKILVQFIIVVLNYLFSKIFVFKK